MDSQLRLKYSGQQIQIWAVVRPNVLFSGMVSGKNTLLPNSCFSVSQKRFFWLVWHKCCILCYRKHICACHVIKFRRESFDREIEGLLRNSYFRGCVLTFGFYFCPHFAAWESSAAFWSAAICLSICELKLCNFEISATVFPAGIHALLLFRAYFWVTFSTMKFWIYISYMYKFVVLWSVFAFLEVCSTEQKRVTDLYRYDLKISLKMLAFITHM